ncbi:MAG: hypothetical protein H0V27_05330 [Pyrinomonadaceae bacterium]|nr:hypothetical protein [Pyrinomonadaceae bacterium]
MEIRTALMTKNEMFAFVSMRITDEGASIVTVDPRQEQPLVKTYEPWLVVGEFRKVLRLSVRNGWRIVYDGQPLWG